MSSGVLKTKVGSFMGTGAAQDIALDFNPRYVRTWNGDTMEAVEQHAENAVTGKEGGYKSGADGVRAGLAAGAGIVLGTRKFTVGTDAGCNKASKVVFFEAVEGI